MKEGGPSLLSKVLIEAHQSVELVMFLKMEEPFYLFFSSIYQFIYLDTFRKEN